MTDKKQDKKEGAEIVPPIEAIADKAGMKDTYHPFLKEDIAANPEMTRLPQQTFYSQYI